ncbi:hypothetical protein OG402_40960 [Streptomyces anulatus]|uniref:hypothetical protein n=1 Tax=Streptomyces anulatus TaxID=1892 RepID=UPI0022548A4A|nr:hypothetical protein [Streptomyces anulatus]MCX4606799.1 hypothetical protein [Streptomyces anulatus]
MTTQPQRLHHLLDRARRGVILPAEGEALVPLVEKLAADVEFYEAATSRMRDRAEVATVRADRAEARVRELEAENARYEEVVGELNEANTRLQRDNARLTAGQCIDSRAMCDQHHAPPVAGCPYPRCRAARNRDQRAATAPAPTPGHDEGAAGT